MALTHNWPIESFDGSSVQNAIVLDDSDHGEELFLRSSKGKGRVLNMPITGGGEDYDDDDDEEFDDEGDDYDDDDEVEVLARKKDHHWVGEAIEDFVNLHEHQLINPNPAPTDNSIINNNPRIYPVNNDAQFKSQLDQSHRALPLPLTLQGPITRHIDRLPSPYNGQDEEFNDLDQLNVESHWDIEDILGSDFKSTLQSNNIFERSGTSSSSVPFRSASSSQLGKMAQEPSKEPTSYEAVYSKIEELFPRICPDHIKNLYDKITALDIAKSSVVENIISDILEAGDKYPQKKRVGKRKREPEEDEEWTKAEREFSMEEYTAT
jgi:hypothetical protein